MKKNLILLVLFMLAISSKAQVFYNTNTVDISTRYWTSQEALEINVNNGVKINPTVVNAVHNNSFSTYSKPEVCISFLLDNKFFSMSFYDNNKIYLNHMEDPYGYDNLFEVNGYIKYASSQPWFEIEWDRIVYNPYLNMIIIPCGVNYENQYYAICADFDVSSTRTKKIEAENEHVFYNIDGTKVVEGVHGKLLIDNEGKKIIMK